MTKTILITGATDGIGAQTARALASAGHRVLIHGRNAEKLARTQRALEEAGSAPLSFQADFADPKQVDAMADALIASGETLDVIINNAGVYGSPKASGPFDLRFEVNTFAPYRLTKRLLSQLANGARVVNLSSAAQAPVDMRAVRGERPLSDHEAYAQSKLALTMWTEAMAARYPDGPVFVAINPGSMLGTKMVKGAFGVSGGDINIGVDILVRAATSPEFENASGKYFDNDAGAFAPPHPAAKDRATRDALMAFLDSLTVAL